MRTDIVLSEEELLELTGYRQAARQGRILQEWGFWRARLHFGTVILEREHYKAVCAGVTAPGGPFAPRTARETLKIGRTGKIKLDIPLIPPDFDEKV